MANPIRDRTGRAVQEGDSVRYYDSTGMWLEGAVVDIGSALGILTSENPIPLYTFARAYIYDGKPIPELLITVSKIEEHADGHLSVIPE